TEGLEVVDGIEQGDVIESAEVTAGLDNLVQPEATESDAAEPDAAEPDVPESEETSTSDTESAE
ncbi:MAG: hypothetical protein AAGC54_12080, partial [Cyanobacteria bacterium P01_F01_bin.4]